MAGVTRAGVGGAAAALGGAGWSVVRAVWALCAHASVRLLVRFCAPLCRARCLDEALDGGGVEDQAEAHPAAAALSATQLREAQDAVRG